ncbi:hypothetical protein TNCV_3684541 [Trichonephila clavipes]|uniref:Uncharacterized protein n=1 Tax=Trichonephila clavipes TaxID=2585209 RepID=A0A8X6V567_TRICX|nr:hypothetical protein TNCV_3684541 [Trichonephila clavipes]
MSSFSIPYGVMVDLRLQVTRQPIIIRIEVWEPRKPKYDGSEGWLNLQSSPMCARDILLTPYDYNNRFFIRIAQLF